MIEDRECGQIIRFGLYILQNALVPLRIVVGSDVCRVLRRFLFPELVDFFPGAIIVLLFCPIAKLAFKPNKILVNLILEMLADRFLHSKGSRFNLWTNRMIENPIARILDLLDDLQVFSLDQSGIEGKYID